MADYGHDLQFGFFLDPSTGNPARTLEIAQILDDLRFDLIGIQDHPYQAKHFDALALIAYILGQTEQIRVFPDVANLPLRPPAMLAKQAATLDQLSNGRFELGLGAGAFWPAIRGMGGPVREPREALAALREAISVIRDYWSGESLRHRGEIYQVVGARPGPQPVHDIGIWLGVTGPRALRLTGELADGWVPSMSYVSPAQAARSNAIIDDAARAAGRDPAAIRRIYNIGGDVSPVVEAGSNDEDQQIVGPRDHWVKVLTHLAVDLGFSTFILWGVPAAPRLRMFIEEIAPAVKEQVAQVRAGRQYTPVNQ
ncbi:MAG TPA: LLM class flavin-dependent oxidoreductase [Thermomicrobiales bacterium]|jgi:alkanesulfonate monooxygenase SsuD/methylene tetrahydromethanopterin reductase-like flavin-dependent oxidoreductase (luciferase family)|nr:LLM class flavin-dependent oxidoreductase [Thermomicrobiales bacterium]